MIRSSGLLTGMRFTVPVRPARTALVLAYGVTIRDKGHREHISGQADLYDEPRARVVSWPRPVRRPALQKNAVGEHMGSKRARNRCWPTAAVRRLPVGVVSAQTRLSQRPDVPSALR